MAVKHTLALCLAAAVFSSACESSTGGDEATPTPEPPTLTLQADTAVMAWSPATWTAKVLDGDGAAVPGVKVYFDVSYAGGSRPLRRDTLVTDARGIASVTGTPSYNGVLSVQALAEIAGKMDTATASVRVRPTVRITRSDGADLDSVTLEGPQCAPTTEIRATGSTGGSFPVAGVNFTSENSQIAGVTRIPAAGGSRGLYGWLVYAGIPGTAHLIGTGEEGGVDTLRVRVTPRSQPLAILAHMPFDRPTHLVPLPDSVVVARGDTAGVTVATSPVSCHGALLPAGYTVTLAIADPAIAGIEAPVAKQWTIETLGLPLSLGTNARLRGVAVGRTELVATAPYTAAKRIQVIVR